MMICQPYVQRHRYWRSPATTSFLFSDFLALARGKSAPWNAIQCGVREQSDHLLGDLVPSLPRHLPELLEASATSCLREAVPREGRWILEVHNDLQRCPAQVSCRRQGELMLANWSPPATRGSRLRGDDDTARGAALAAACFAWDGIGAGAGAKAKVEVVARVRAVTQDGTGAGSVEGRAGTESADATWATSRLDVEGELTERPRPRRRQGPTV